MSVINQVLNQLEQRGEHAVTEQAMVRVVSRSKSDYVVRLILPGAVLIAGLAAGFWMFSRQSETVMQSVTVPQSATVPETVQLALQTPLAAGADAQQTGAASVEFSEPASRLSLELSSLPLPSSLRSYDSARDKGASGQESAGSFGAAAGVTVPAANSATSARVAAGRQQAVPVTTEKAADMATGNTVPMKKISIAQQADAEFRRAAGLMQLGRITDAISGYEAALRLDAGHGAARQALVALLLEGKRNTDAEKVLIEGLEINPGQTGLTMLLARLQAERGALAQATATLEKSLPYADTQADYRAFLAALLQRQNRNEDAVAHYQVVLQHAPGNGVWLMGYGISLQGLQRNAEAKEAYQRALDTQTLTPELQAFVQQKIKEL